MKIVWLGHSGFRIEIEDQVLLIDPWLAGNPLFPEERRAEAIGRKRFSGWLRSFSTSQTSFSR